MEDLIQKKERKLHRTQEPVASSGDANKKIRDQFLTSKCITSNTETYNIQNLFNPYLPSFLKADTTRQKASNNQFRKQLMQHQKPDSVIRSTSPAYRVIDRVPDMEYHSTSTPSVTGDNHKNKHKDNNNNSAPATCGASVESASSSTFELNASSSLNNTMNCMQDSSSPVSPYSNHHYRQTNYYPVASAVALPTINVPFNSAFNTQHYHHHHFNHQISASPKSIPIPLNPSLSLNSTSTLVGSSRDYVILHNNNSSSTLIANDSNYEGITTVKVSKWSRTGCLTCKARKKKCDETKPVCTECLRVNMTCIYRSHSQENGASNDADDTATTTTEDKERPLAENETIIDGIGVVKVLRAKVDYKIENGKIVYKA